MNRKSEKFFDAVTHLREDLIEEAQNHKFRQKSAVWKTFGSLAACIVLIMSIGILAILPRGCGSGGGADSGSSAAPTTNSQDAPVSGDTAPPLYGSSGSSEPGALPDEGVDGAPSDAIELYRFTAIVLEVKDDAILVVPAEYDSYYQFLILSSNLDLPALTEGDWITVTCTSGPVFTSDPPVVTGVQSIEKINLPE